MGRKRKGGSTSEEGEREVEQRRDERGAGEVGPRGEREGGGVVVERGGAAAERGAGEVVLDEAVDADGGGRVADRGGEASLGKSWNGCFGHDEGGDGHESTFQKSRTATMVPRTEPETLDVPAVRGR